MIDTASWIFENADAASFVVYLVLTLVVGGYGLYKRWFVIGWQYNDAVAARDLAFKERDELRKRIDDRTERLERKLEVLEEAERLASKPRSRTSGSSS